MAKPVRVAIAGLGTVGAAVAAWVQRRPEQFTLTAVSARDPKKDRGMDLSRVAWCAPTELVDKADVIVELMGGADGDALALAKATIAAQKPFVTANKAMLAKHWDDLNPLENRMHFEASVAGGIPVVAAVKDSLAANKIIRISGILNGTCNYILTRMGREGASYAEVLADAQRLGYAEADPTFDVEGYDTAHKLYVLARLAGGALQLGDIAVNGIARLDAHKVRDAFATGGAVRLVATADFAAGSYIVEPKTVPAGHPLASVDGATNAVLIEGDMMPALTMIGAGAGAMPTASAVCGDLLAARNLTYI